MEIYILIVILVYLTAVFTNTWDAIKGTIAWLAYKANTPLLIATSVLWSIAIVLTIFNLDRPAWLTQSIMWTTGIWIALTLYVAIYRIVTKDFPMGQEENI